MNQILMKKFFYIGLILLKSIHPVQDETEMRLSKIKEKETRPRKDCLKNCHPRQNRDKTSSRFLYKTKSLGIFSLETRSRLSSFTERHSFYPIEVDIWDSNLSHKYGKFEKSSSYYSWWSNTFMGASLAPTGIVRHQTLKWSVTLEPSMGRGGWPFYYFLQNLYRTTIWPTKEFNKGVPWDPIWLKVILKPIRPHIRSISQN